MRRRVLASLLCLVSSENDNDLRWRLLQSSHSCWPGCVLASHVLVRLRLTEGVGCDLTLSCASGTIKDGKTKMLSRPGRFACTFCFNLNMIALRSAVFSALRRLGLAVRQRHGPPPPQRRLRLRKPRDHSNHRWSLGCMLPRVTAMSLWPSGGKSHARREGPGLHDAEHDDGAGAEEVRRAEVVHVHARRHPVLRRSVRADWPPFS